MASFSELITHTRASTATYVDSSGILQTAASGVPRVGHHIYDGSQWVNEGILHESEARTNLLPYSEDFTSGWSNNDITVVSNAALAPDGSTTADLIYPTTSSLPLIYRSSGNAIGNTASLYIKPAGFSWVAIGTSTNDDARVYFDLVNGLVGAVGTVLTNPTISSAGNDFFRISFTTKDPIVGNSSFAIWPADGNAPLSCTPNGTSGLYIWGAQLEEESPTPSSYIPTAGSQVTRAADSMIIPAAKLPYDATNMSIAMEGRLTWAYTGTIRDKQFVRWAADSNNAIEQFASTGSGTFPAGSVSFFQEVSGTSAVKTAPEGAVPLGINVPFSIASRHGSTFINGAVDGTALTENTTPTALPDLSATDLDLGFDFMGTIRLFRMWNEDLGDTGIEEASA